MMSSLHGAEGDNDKKKEFIFKGATNVLDLTLAKASRSYDYQGVQHTGKSKCSEFGKVGNFVP